MLIASISPQKGLEEINDEALADWVWEIRVEAVSMATTAEFVEIRVTHVSTGLFHRVGYLHDGGTPE